MPTPALRVRLELPPWMQAWPAGLRPHALHGRAGVVELLYRLPEDRWVRVKLHREGARFQVQPAPSRHEDPQARERLCRALTARLTHARASAGPWLDAVSEAVVQLERADEDEQLAGIDEADAGLLHMARALAESRFDDALAQWEAHEAAWRAREDLPASIAVATMEAFTGDHARARASARSLAGPPGDLADDRARAELLEHLGEARLALRAMAATAHGERFDSHRRLAVVARKAGDDEATVTAAAAMARTARDADELLAAVDFTVDAGAFARAEAMLVEALERGDATASPAAELRLAKLRLWRGQADDAARRARALLDAGHDFVELRRTLGAAELLRGRPEHALAQLDEAMTRIQRRSWGEGPDEETALWHAEARLRLGDLEGAHASVMECHLGDHPAWQLLRALIEERDSPRRVIDDKTWFIIDSLLEDLLGERWPADDRLDGGEGPDHEQAVAAIEAALRRLGGNRGPRLTALVDDKDKNGGESLRWIDEVQSPRRRAELLQLRLVELGPERMLEEFAALERRHPQVPFNVTYAAELNLWMGRYEQALARFSEVWERTRTRWGYVGAGACLLYLGRLDEALEIWEAGKRHYDYLDAEATYAYRGELRRLRGELEAAREDLEQAVKFRPSRLGAWVELALTCLAQGDEARTREAAARVQALAPVLVWEARRALGPGVQDPAALFEQMREMMRGNRSSVIHTFVGPGGNLCIMPSGALEAWREYGRRLADTAEAHVRALQVARLVDRAQRKLG